MQQLPISLYDKIDENNNLTYKERISKLIRGDLSFHGKNGLYATHWWHSFPAKFPPQLPRKFIEELTYPGDVILDPMMGSCTTLVEALLLNRQAFGCDIDPLSLLIGNVKLTPIDKTQAEEISDIIIKNAKNNTVAEKKHLINELCVRFDEETIKFINFWFDTKTQIELLSLIIQIEKVKSESLRKFFILVFSSIIITKSGGVSLAIDLAHTRPHKLKDKIPNSPIIVFEKKIRTILRTYVSFPTTKFKLYTSDARNTPFEQNSVDLIVTSPPYASNAIDYVRAHKFSLVWLGYSINTLSKLRRMYIGGESLNNVNFLPLPYYSAQIVKQLVVIDKKKGYVLHRYFSEMIEVLTEMYRILKPGKAAIVVIGNSTLRGITIETHKCLSEIGQDVGFELAGIGKRQLDRDKRMLPARWNIKNVNQIETRIHEEYIICLLKPEFV